MALDPLGHGAVRVALTSDLELLGTIGWSSSASRPSESRWQERPSDELPVLRRSRWEAAAVAVVFLVPAMNLPDSAWKDESVGSDEQWRGAAVLSSCAAMLLLIVDCGSDDGEVKSLLQGRRRYSRLVATRTVHSLRFQSATLHAIPVQLACKETAPAQSIQAPAQHLEWQLVRRSHHRSLRLSSCTSQ